MSRGRKDPSSPAPSESELCGEFNFSSSYESSILRTAEIEFNDWNALRAGFSGGYSYNGWARPQQSPIHLGPL